MPADTRLAATIPRSAVDAKGGMLGENRRPERDPIAANGGLTRGQRSALLRRGIAAPCAIFLPLLAAYAFNLLLIATTGGPLAFLLSLPCAVVIGSMFVIGHDACHHAFSSSRILNHVIGRIAFLTSLHNFSLWDVGHNRTHHRYTNLRGKDYPWEPMSPEEFAAARTSARMLYRFFRTPLGVPLYYTFDIWARRMAFARPSVVGLVCPLAPVHIADTLLVWLYAAGLAATLAAIATAFGTSIVSALCFGLFLPIIVCHWMISIVIYIQHTHPAVPWFREGNWSRERSALFATVHVRFPLLIDKILLDVMHHNAHHLLAGIPLYKLASAQRLVAAPGMPSWRWSLAGWSSMLLLRERLVGGALTRLPSFGCKESSRCPPF